MNKYLNEADNESPDQTAHRGLIGVFAVRL